MANDKVVTGGNIRFDLNKIYSVKAFLHNAEAFAALYRGVSPQQTGRFREWADWAKTLPDEADIYFSQDDETGEFTPIATTEELEWEDEDEEEEEA